MTHFKEEDIMLKEKNSYGNWDISDTLEEQLYFETSEGIQPMIHGKYNPNENDRPYLVKELIENYTINKLRNLPRKKAFTDTQLQEMLNDRMQGMSIRNLAKKYNKSTTTIQKYIKAAQKSS